MGENVLKKSLKRKRADLARSTTQKKNKYILISISALSLFCIEIKGDFLCAISRPIFFSPQVVLPSFISRFALVRCLIDSNTIGSKKKIGRVVFHLSVFLEFDNSMT